jgi:hypothetical protein
MLGLRIYGLALGYEGKISPNAEQRQPINTNQTLQISLLMSGPYGPSRQQFTDRRRTGSDHSFWSPSRGTNSGVALGFTAIELPGMVLAHISDLNLSN